MYTHICVCMYVRMYVFLYLHTYIHTMYIYIYMHIACSAWMCMHACMRIKGLCAHTHACTSGMFVLARAKYEQKRKRQRPIKHVWCICHTNGQSKTSGVFVTLTSNQTLLVYLSHKRPIKHVWCICHTNGQSNTSGVFITLKPWSYVLYVQVNEHRHIPAGLLHRAPRQVRCCRPQH